jgi:hypothetical protein
MTIRDQWVTNTTSNTVYVNSTSGTSNTAYVSPCTGGNITLSGDTLTIDSGGCHVKNNLQVGDGLVMTGDMLTINSSSIMWSEIAEVKELKKRIEALEAELAEYRVRPETNVERLRRKVRKFDLE